jgi:hypothetical protein
MAGDISAEALRQVRELSAKYPNISARVFLGDCLRAIEALEVAGHADGRHYVNL